MLPVRGVSRLFILGLFVLITLALLLASPFSGHAGRKSRKLISSVVQKVQNGDIGRLRVGGISANDEELAMRCVGLDAVDRVLIIASGSFGELCSTRVRRCELRARQTNN